MRSDVWGSKCEGPSARTTCLARRRCGAVAGAGACPGAGPAAAAPGTGAGARAAPPAGTRFSPPPVVFVHGNGDLSALWINNIWRFEANGYKRSQLFAIDFTYPNARRDDSKPEPFRSSTEDQMKELAAFVAQVREGDAAAQGGAGRLVARRQHGAQLPQERRRRGVREPCRAVRHAQQGHRDLRHHAGRQRVQRRLPLPQGTERGAGRSHPRRRA